MNTMEFLFIGALILFFYGIYKDRDCVHDLYDLLFLIIFNLIRSVTVIAILAAALCIGIGYFTT